jgi:hypothetical protein
MMGFLVLWIVGIPCEAGDPADLNFAMLWL